MARASTGTVNTACTDPAAMGNLAVVNHDLLTQRREPFVKGVRNLHPRRRRRGTVQRLF